MSNYNDNDYDRAEYEASLDEDRMVEIEDAIAEYGPECGWCGETAIDPVLHAKGTRGEELMCRRCDAEVSAIPYSDDRENFGCDYGIGVSDAYLEGPTYWD